MTAIAGTVGVGSSAPAELTAAEVADPDQVFVEEAAQAAASSNKTKSVRFVCNRIPELKLTLPSGNVIQFKRGVGYATSKKDTSAVRNIAAKYGIVDG